MYPVPHQGSSLDLWAGGEELERPDWPPADKFRPSVFYKLNLERKSGVMAKCPEKPMPAWKCLIGNIKRVSFGNTKDYFFLVSYLALPMLTLTLNDMLDKKDYILKMILMRPSLRTNARVVFKLCLLLIIRLTFHASHTWFIHGYT